MDKYRKIVESALRFTPERMEPLITDVHFRPFFVRNNGFVFVKERFDESGNKQKVYTVYDAASDAESELFDHPAFAAALAAVRSKRFSLNLVTWKSWALAERTKSSMSCITAKRIYIVFIVLLIL